MKLRIDNPLASGERAIRLKKAGELAMWHGKKCADMSRAELLMFIGLMCQNQISQGKQLRKAAEDIECLTDMLAQK